MVVPKTTVDPGGARWEWSPPRRRSLLISAPNLDPLLWLRRVSSQSPRGPLEGHACVHTIGSSILSKLIYEGMVVPKTTVTRYRGGSIQARQGIQRLHKYISFFTISFSMLSFCRLHYEIAGNSTDGEKKRCRDGVTCVVFVCPVLPAYCHPYTDSFCGFWHWHPYIPLHLCQMFFILAV